jgi:hypothetical protein
VPCWRSAEGGYGNDEAEEEGERRCEPVNHSSPLKHASPVIRLLAWHCHRTDDLFTCSVPSRLHLTCIYSIHRPADGIETRHPM